MSDDTSIYDHDCEGEFRVIVIGKYDSNSNNAWKQEEASPQQMTTHNKLGFRIQRDFLVTSSKSVKNAT